MATVEPLELWRMVACGCGWVGAVIDCDPRPDSLVCCPACGSPVARVDEPRPDVMLSREDLDRVPLPAVRDAVADAMSRRLHEEVGRRMLGPDPASGGAEPDVVVGGEG